LSGRFGHAVGVALAFATMFAVDAGCVRAGAYVCTRDQECTLAGAQGTCELVGYCSFPDPTCSDGRRYGEQAGPYASQCVTPETSPDAGTQPGPCTLGPTGAFSTPAVIPALSDPLTIDGTPTLTDDGLEIDFKSSRAGGLGNSDIWRSTRATTTSTWSPPVAVTELNTTVEDASPEISGDGLTIWFSSQRPGGQGNRDIWVATRPTRSSTWSTPTPVVELNTNRVDDGFAVLPSELVAYLHSTRGAKSSFYRTTRPTRSAAWSTPVLVPGQDLASDSENAWVSPDECEIYFASNRVGGGNNYDLYVARRTSPSAALGAASMIAELSSTGWDDDVWLSADRRYIMFDSNRVDGASQFDLYEATR
jgi:hypothetical protein